MTRSSSLGLKLTHDLFGPPVLGEEVDSRRDGFRHALFGGPFGPGDGVPASRGARGRRLGVEMQPGHCQGAR